MNGQEMYRLADEVMAGKLEMNDMIKDVKTICSLRTFIIACEILEFETKERRRHELEKLPKLLRPHVEKWVWEIWRTRNA